MICLASCFLGLTLVGLFFTPLPACILRAWRALSLALLTTGNEASLAILIILQANLLAVRAGLCRSWAAFVIA